jgi:hypothetical protein
MAAKKHKMHKKEIEKVSVSTLVFFIGFWVINPNSVVVFFCAICAFLRRLFLAFSFPALVR